MRFVVDTKVVSEPLRLRARSTHLGQGTHSSLATSLEARSGLTVRSVRKLHGPESARAAPGACER